MYRVLRRLAPASVAEIGGGNSRVLPLLHRQGWTCVNIDPLEGRGNGPQTSCQDGAISRIPVYVGRSDPQIATGSYDASYSISVVEHVSNEEMEMFFSDLFRIMKPGSVSYHAVDIVLGDTELSYAKQRISLIYASAVKAGFTLLDDNENIETLSPVIFKSRYASNADETMYQWQKMTRSDCFIENQCCTLFLGICKKVE